MCVCVCICFTSFQQLMSYGINNLKIVPPCTDAKGIESYLNRPDVRQAIHIPDKVPEWEICR